MIDHRSSPSCSARSLSFDSVDVHICLSAMNHLLYPWDFHPLPTVEQFDLRHVCLCWASLDFLPQDLYFDFFFSFHLLDGAFREPPSITCMSRRLRNVSIFKTTRTTDMSRTPEKENRAAKTHSNLFRIFRPLMMKFQFRLDVQLWTRMPKSRCTGIYLRRFPYSTI